MKIQTKTFDIDEILHILAACFIFIPKIFHSVFYFSMKPPVILLAFANDRQDNSRYLRGLADELRGIRQALQPAKRAGKVDIIEIANASLSDIIDAFTDPENAGRIKIFHYAGHADSFRLMLETTGGVTEYANAEGFSSFLARQGSLSLVFLNACSTKAQADGLLAKGIPTVIATSSVISDNIATQLSIRFYKSIASYRPVSQAFQDATDEIKTLYGENNFRKVYWDALPENEVPAVMPWDIYPTNNNPWKLEPPLTQASNINFKIGPFSHLMVDRNEQNDEFVSSFSMGITKPVRKPLTFLIHGKKDDRHESLITRFSFETVGKSNYIRPYEIRNWPVKGSPDELKHLLKMRLLESLEALNWSGKNTDIITAKDIVYNPFFATQKNIIFQHNIPGEEWSAATDTLLSWYIGEFWNIDITDAFVPNFVIFINILYSPDQEKSGFFSSLFSKKYFKDKISDNLSKLAMSHNDRCRLLSELSGVKKDHFDTWVVESKLSDFQEFISLADTLFRQDSQNTPFISMLNLEIILKKTIDNFLTKNSGLYG
ncbi:MAG: CHAT domain-containing protein [Bacteroidia bacterium]|nr:CHAT domain-containing protein [Bacteroidia bacterium]